MKRTVVLDVDDVLLDLNGAVEKVVVKKYPSFSFRKARTYGLNSSLTDEEKEQEGICVADPWNGLGAPKSYIMSQYATVSSYRDASWYDMPRLAELCRKCNVVFHTAGFTVDVCKFKVAQLNALLDRLGVTACVSVQLTGSMVFVNLGDGDTEAVLDRGFVSKPALVCDYIVEDSLENLKGYSGCKRILVDKPYNQLKFYTELSDMPFERVTCISEAIDLILDEVDDE